MGMGPLHLYTTSPEEAEAQRVQEYQQMFNQSGAAPIPGTQPQSSYGGMHPNPQNTQSMMNGLLSQYMNQAYTPADWRGLLPQGQGSTVPQQPPAPGGGGAMAGPYGRQAMLMAGLLSPNAMPPTTMPPAAQPGDTYPNGLLGGKRGAFRPGGK